MVPILKEILTTRQVAPIPTPAAPATTTRTRMARTTTPTIMGQPTTTRERAGEMAALPPTPLLLGGLQQRNRI